MTDISIIGCGFAALTAARHLRRHLPDAGIDMIAPRPELLYAPSLIWIPSGLRRPEQLRIPVERFLERHRIRFHASTVQGLADQGRTVVTRDGEIANDGLVIASGGRFIRKLPGIEHAIALCEGIEAAEAIRDRLGAMAGGRIAFGFGGNPKEPSAMRGGPMFELLFGIDTLLRRQGRRDRFELTFFSAAAEPGKRLGARAVKRLLAEMERRGIGTHLGHRILGFEADRVRTEGGEVEADLILFMPGMTGPAWVADSGLPLSPGGLVQADEHCRVPGLERVYVAGDCGSYPGPDWMPRQAHMADLQAAAAAENLALEMGGGRPRATFRTELVCIVDSLDRGILVYRNPRRSIMFQSRLLHHAKRFFEWWYLRRYRRG